ncbi:MAG: beta-galactosidase [Mobilitalea sp.]
MKDLIYGVAYYDEYMPYDRLKEDIIMMKAAGINTVRIAESTWSTLEPQDNCFDFTHIDRVINAMEENDMKVIVGTPTYAIPTWMAKAYPEVIATTKRGKGIYGARQNMDITNLHYLSYSERIIRKLIEHVAANKCVIGYQLDNETKYYDTAGEGVQQQFVEYLREKFQEDIEAMNEEFGLDYWSNRINSWEDFPDVRGTINGSLGAEFEKFQRTLVNDFLSWQADIVAEYKRDDQFVTQNFDFDWRGYSYGMQSAVNHFKASECLTIAGCDIYHPGQDQLTGEEIAFGGDMTRSLKQDNYLVLETQAQGHLSWLPYKGQLRLQAYSHLASGANAVMYWHWHSIHNSFETYWKGLLSHDFCENDTYLEAKIIGNEWKQIGSKLINLKKKNQTAILVSNESLTALNWFRVDTGMIMGSGFAYNDILRWVYNSLFHLNVECDFITSDMEVLENYKLIVIPALYSVSEKCLNRINAYVKNGGNIITTFKTAVSDENVKVYHDTQPHILHECLGITYNQFTKPEKVTLSSKIYHTEDADPSISIFMELIKTTGAEVMASYQHYNWEPYAAITQNHYGKGIATYIGCYTSESYLNVILQDSLRKAGLWSKEQELPDSLIVRRGINDFGKEIAYYLNYSNEAISVPYTGENGIDLLEDSCKKKDDIITIKPWDLVIIES